MKLLTRRYEEIKKEIKKFFIRYGIDTFPFDPFEICKKMNIELVKYSTLSLHAKMKLYATGNSDAVSCIDSNNKIMIFYNDIKLPERIRFSLMHELGHIVLEHLERSAIAEIESNFFAAYSLAPTAIIDYFNPSTPQEIAKRFYVSTECAENRMEQYKLWKDKGQYSYYSCDEEFLPLFKDYLQGGEQIAG